MIIEIKTLNNINTELYNLLSSLPKNILFNKEHELREPLGIYNISISRVFRAFENFLEKFQKERIDLQDLDLAHMEVLESIMAFIDDGYLIMKCFYPKDSVEKEIIFADKWMESVDVSLVKKYKSDISPYRSKLALIVNKTKHNHARYCHVELKYRFNKVIAYYIEGINENGVIQPNKEIHPMYNGTYTAISYNKDIREQLGNVYFIAHHLANTIKKIILKNFDIKLETLNHEYNDNDKIIKIFNKINKLKEAYMPDEYNENLTQIIMDNSSIQIRKPVYKSYLNKLFKEDMGAIGVIFNGDGVTVSWSLPYFKGK